MPNYSKNEIVLVSYPFSDLSGLKVRPAVVINGPHLSHDLLLTPLTSRIMSLLEGEFVLLKGREAGLNVVSAVKRGIFTIEERLVVKRIGHLLPEDGEKLEASLGVWLGLQIAPKKG